MNAETFLKAIVPGMLSIKTNNENNPRISVVDTQLFSIKFIQFLINFSKDDSTMLT